MIGDKLYFLRFPTEGNNYKHITKSPNFPAITAKDKGIKAGSAQTITCSLNDLGVAADVKWIDPEGHDIPAGDSTNYVVDDGKSSFSAGSQTAKLTLKPSKTGISSSTTYQCSVTPLEFSGTQAFKEDVIVTPIGKS